MYVAFHAKNLECVKALLENKAYICEYNNITCKDIFNEFPNFRKKGRMPLHWATSKNVINAIVKLGCHIDKKKVENKAYICEYNNITCKDIFRSIVTFGGSGLRTPRR